MVLVQIKVILTEVSLFFKQQSFTEDKAVSTACTLNSFT